MKIITSLSQQQRQTHLTNAIKTKNNATIIVPEQFLFETERSMYGLIGAKKIAVTDITSFSKLSSDIIKKYGEPKLYADDIIKTVTMYKTVSRLKKTFTYFMFSKSAYELAERMLSVTADFKAAAITQDILRDSLNAVRTETGEQSPLSAKLRDITEIYCSYCETLNADFADKADDCLNAADLINRHSPFAGKEVFLYEFDGLSESQLALLKALENSAANVTLMLRTDKRLSEQSPLKAMNAFIKKLERAVSVETEELGGESNSPQISLWEGNHVTDECEFVCSEIRRLVTEENYSFNDIAVIACEQNAVPQLLETMGEYDIKAYADLPEPILSKPIIRFIITALQAANLDAPELMRYIRSGFVRVPAMIEPHSPNKKLSLKATANKRYAVNGLSSKHTKRLSKLSMDLLERNAARFALTKREWRKPFPEQNADLFKAETLRRHIVTPLTELKTTIDKCKDGAEITEALCAFLLDTIQLQKTVSGLCREFSREHEFEEAFKSEAVTNEFRQLWDLVIDVFESLHASLNGFPMSITEYTDLLKGVFSSVSIAKPPQVLDAVAIADTERSRLNGIKCLFVTGANQDRFPKSVAKKSDGCGFSGKELDILSDSGVEIEPNLEQRYNFERFIVNKTMTLPSHKLYLSAPLSDISWNELQLSPLFKELSKQETHIPVNKISDLPLSYKARTPKALRRLYGEANGKQRRQLDLITEADFVKPTEKQPHKLNPETVQLLFKSGLELFSPTKIDTLMSCRFKFFCDYGLRLDLPRLENEEEPQNYTRGNIIHFCLERVLRHINEIGSPENTPDFDENLNRFIEQNLRDYRNISLPYDYAKTNRQEYLLLNLKTGIFRMVKHILSDLNNSPFKAVEFEKEIVAEIGGIKLKGKIDRVDISSDENGNYIRVFDYKSKKDYMMNFPAVFYGYDMQTLLYLYSLCETELYKPASALYIPSNGAEVKEVLMPKDGKLTVDVPLERKNWLNSHKQSGIAVYDDTLGLQQQRYLTETKAHRNTKFINVEHLSPDGYNNLKNHCVKLIAAKVKSVKRGDIEAVPLAFNETEGIKCEFCSYKSACNVNRLKTVNKQCIKRVVNTPVSKDGKEQ